MTKPDEPASTTGTDWYASPAGRRQTRREFERALKQGTLVYSSGSKIPRSAPATLRKLLEQAKANATRPVSIRLPLADIERAKEIASETGSKYQTVLKKAIRFGLKRAS